MSTTMRNQMRNVMFMAWRFFRITGETFAECLKKAWENIKLVQCMRVGIVRFYFQKVDGTIREAWGTLKNVEDKVKGDRRTKNETIQVYFDTERQEFRSFKRFNLITK